MCNFFRIHSLSRGSSELQVVLVAATGYVDACWWQVTLKLATRYLYNSSSRLSGHKTSHTVPGTVPTIIYNGQRKSKIHKRDNYGHFSS